MGRILIVDDHLDQCIPLLRLMHKTGHSAACVSDGQTALGMVRLSKPDLVLLDAMMPDMDGTQVLREIRRDPMTAELPVIMFTSIVDHGYREHVMGLGATDFWVKASIDFNEMERRLLCHVPRKRMQFS
jgi:CheY-like chemotaxis protein